MREVKQDDGERPRTPLDWALIVLPVLFVLLLVLALVVIRLS